MKDFEYKAVRDYCKPIAETWIARMGCSWDRVELFWSDHYFCMERDSHPPECMAYCDADWKYLHAAITFSCPKLWEYFDGPKPKDPDFIEELIIHEIVHILLCEMRMYDSSRHDATVGHEERVATRIARAFQHTYKEGLRNANAKRQPLPRDKRSRSKPSRR